MKQLTSILIALILPVVLFAQKIVDNPVHGYSTAGSLNLNRVELNDTASILSFNLKHGSSGWMSIPVETYIQAVGSEEKLYVTATEGVPLKERVSFSESGDLNYQLFFPPVPVETALLNYGEANEGGNWAIYEIRLNESGHSSLSWLSGHWFDGQTGLYAASFSDREVIYKNKVWTIGECDLNTEKANLSLNRDSEQLKLFVEKSENGITLGSDKKHLQALVARRNRMAVARNGNVDLETPLFSLDSADYSGYFIGFNPNYVSDRFTVYSNNLLSGVQEKTEVKIDSNGFFHARIPVYYPHVVFKSGVGGSDDLYLAPGKALFQVIDLTNNKAKRLYGGDCAAMSSEIIDTYRVSNLSRRTAIDSVHGGSFADYKAYCLQAKLRDLENLKKLYDDGKLSKRAYQLHQMDVAYNCLYTILDYGMACA